jgi:hypothetical protein
MSDQTDRWQAAVSARAAEGRRSRYRRRPPQVTGIRVMPPPRLEIYAAATPAGQVRAVEAVNRQLLITAGPFVLTPAEAVEVACALLEAARQAQGKAQGK